MIGLSSDISIWLSKFVRESWRLEVDGTVMVTGNITINDSNIQRLPVKFSRVSGKFKCMNCTSLISNEGFPRNAHEWEFENCALPQEWYIASMKEKLSMEDYVNKHFSSLLETHESLIQLYFPSFIETHRGTVKGREFGF